MSITGAGNEAPINASSVPLVSARRYVSNVLWTWLGVATGIAGGLFVTPYMVRKIGVDHFSMWTLVLSLVEYYWLIDIGLRSASLKFSAEYYALGQQDELDHLVNTGLAYSLGAGAIVALLTVFGAPYAGRLFHISDPVFPQLIRVVGISWAVGLVFNIFGACIEGFQRFDIFGRIWVSTTVLRTITIVLILALGYGVLQMGLVLLASQTLVYLLNLYYFRRLAPQARINLSLATFTKFKEMARYGVHTLRVIVSDRLLRQAVPVMIPYYLPLRDLAFYALPMRILDYAMDGVGRVGNVTTPTATELLAKGRREQLVDLTVYANRYSLAIFLPIPIFLLVYGGELYAIWMGADIASHSAYLLPAFLFGHAMVASQMNSISTFNQARKAQKNLPIAIHVDSHLVEAACSGTSDAQGVLRDEFGARTLVIFTSSSPDKMPKDMFDAAADPNLARMNLGVCYRPGKPQGNASFRIVAALFPVAQN